MDRSMMKRINSLKHLLFITMINDYIQKEDQSLAFDSYLTSM